MAQELECARAVARNIRDCFIKVATGSWMTNIRRWDRETGLAKKMGIVGFGKQITGVVEKRKSPTHFRS